MPGAFAFGFVATSIAHPGRVAKEWEELKPKNCGGHKVGRKRWLVTFGSTIWREVQKLGRQVVEVGSKVELCDGKYVAGSEVKAGKAECQIYEA